MKLSSIHLIGFPLDFNGNLQRALYESIHIAKLGSNVDFVVSSQAVSSGILARSIPKEYTGIANFRVYPCKPILPSGKIGWRVNNLLALPVGALKHAYSRHGAIMHVHSPSPVTKPLSISLIKKLLGVPILVDLHDPWSGYPFSKSPINLLQTGIMRYVIDNADAIVVAHTALINLVNRVNKSKPVTLIPNGVDTQVFQPRPRSLSLMKKLKLGFQDQIVLFSGHMTEEKGLDLLAYAAKTVTKKIHNARFVVIGDGPVRNKIMNIVRKLGLQNFFRFTGFVKTEDLSDYMSLADICVCPYKPLPHYDVMKIETPMKVVQYLSVGKPVIMSKVSEENVVSWSGGGLLITPGDPEKLAEAIADLLEDGPSREIMGKKGRKYVEDNLDWGSIAKKLIEIYQSLRQKYSD